MQPADAICGLNAVTALFARRPGDVLRLFHSESMRHAAGPLCAALAAQHRPYRMLPSDELARAAGTEHHAGIVAIARPRAIPVLNPQRPPRHRLLLVLEEVGNPHNLGAIARSAAFFGCPALVFAGGAMPSAAAYRTAEGGLEYLDLYRVHDLPAALDALDPPYRTVAAALTADAMPLPDLPRDRPVALVLGNEERGVSRPVLDACRRRVRIPGARAGRMQSLNVAQAAAVLLYALSV